MLKRINMKFKLDLEDKSRHNLSISEDTLWGAYWWGGGGEGDFFTVLPAETKTAELSIFLKIVYI
jgi:hypothetical protein